jgi:hypothetical protein
MVRAATVVIVAAVLAACGGSSNKSDPPTSSRQKAAVSTTTTLAPTTTTTKPKPHLHAPAIPATGAYLGLWRGPGPGRPPQESPNAANLQMAEAAIGRKIAIDHTYYPWATPLPSAYVQGSVAQGHIPMISVCSCYWDKNNTPVMWAAIAGGTYDTYLVSIADGLKSLKVPTFFLFDAEPDTNVGTRGSVGDYVAAFRRVVDIFRQRRAYNVAFVWSVTGYAFQPASGQAQEAASLYPGDHYVDWLGVDPYNFFKNGNWVSLASDMGDWYQWAHTAHPDKPLMLSEWGSVEDPSVAGRKAQWLQDASNALQTQFPAVKAVVYFDEQKAEQGTVHDWRIDTSATALAAFRTLAGQPWFRVKADTRTAG